MFRDPFALRTPLRTNMFHIPARTGALTDSIPTKTKIFSFILAPPPKVLNPVRRGGPIAPTRAARPSRMLLHDIGAAVGYAMKCLQDNAHMGDDFEADQRENDDRQNCDG